MILRGENHGLRNVYIRVSGHGRMRTGTAYPGGPKKKKKSDKGDSVGRGNLIYYIEQDEVAFAQADWFCRHGAEGLT